MNEAQALLAQLAEWGGPPLTFMEVCGTHTMAAARAGLRTLLPERVRLISGPGCPVCVTPVGFIDHALALAQQHDVILATFGDLMRVPGSQRGGGAAPPSLQRAKAGGADVRVVYSPLGALALARAEREREVVFLGVGFETTTPTVAAAVLQAAREGLDNFSVLGAHKTIPEAMDALATSDELRVDGFLCPGHVSVILGPEVYAPLVEQRGVPCAIAGFETVEILRGLAAMVAQIEAGQPRVDNCYMGAVRAGGNPKARSIAAQVFTQVDSTWRGLGVIPQSGLEIAPAYAAHDAARRFQVELAAPVEPKGCRCGDVLRGVLDPADCALFGRACTPEAPQGACMVSSEGSCAARYHYTEGEGS